MSNATYPGSRDIRLRDNIRRWIPYVPFPLIWAVDQATKTEAERIYGGVAVVLPGWLEFRVIHQTGDIVGFLGGRFVLAGMVFALGVLTWWAIRTPETRVYRHYGFSCMIGGALGNLTDRLARGHVVDFVEVWRLPIFNLADLALIAGMILITFDVLYTPKTGTPKAGT